MPKVMSKNKAESVVMIGIDPGVNGGIVSMHNGEISLHRMPATEWEIVKLFRETGLMYSNVVSKSTANAIGYWHRRAAVEYINPGFSGIGKSSAAKLYGSFMALKMALAAFSITLYAEVKPQKWQAEFNIKKRGKNEDTIKWKDRLRQKAQQIFPNLEAWNETLEYQRAVCDALLIAEWLRRQPF